MEPRYRCLDGELFSTPAPPGHFLPFAHAACDIRAQCEEFDVLSVDRLESGWDEDIDRLLESLGGRVAKHPLCGLVEEGDPMLGVHGNDRVASNRKNTSELCLRAARGMLPLLAHDFCQVILPNRTDAANRIEPISSPEQEKLGDQASVRVAIEYIVCNRTINF